MAGTESAPVTMPFYGRFSWPYVLRARQYCYLGRGTITRREVPPAPALHGGWCIHVDNDALKRGQRGHLVHQRVKRGRAETAAGTELT
jgi:hypothetical protein